MTKEEVIKIIKRDNPDKKIVSLVEFSDCYSYRMEGEQAGLMGISTINKLTGEKEKRTFFNLDDNTMKVLIKS